MREAFSAIPTFLIVLCGSTTGFAGSIIKARDYPLNIDWDPAPSPEDGPPISAGALRDKAYLPAEIGGIVGAYAFIVAVTLLALLVVGRRLRRATELAAKPKDVEMLDGALANKAFFPTPASPASAFIASQNLPWPSPEKNNRNPYVFPSQSYSPVSPASNPAVDSRIVEADREVLHRGLEDLYAHVMVQEYAKAAGFNVADMPAPIPLPSASPQRQSTTSTKGLDKVKAPEKSHFRTSSIISSIKSPRRKGIRGMRISSPIPTPLSSTFPHNYASDEEPLSPRHYQPAPPPPVPKDQVPYPYHSRNNSSVNTSTNPSPVSPTRSIADNLASLPTGPPRNNRSIATARPPNLTIPSISTSNLSPVSATNSTRQLPFRAFDPPPGLSSPSFSHCTKTTVLERTTPLSPGLKAPWSAGAVPYSPYQPFSPLIPITPRLVTREDRKAMKKMEPKSPVMEMVKGEDELWDSGY